MAVTIIPNVTNWSVTPQNGQVGYFSLMNTWLSESTAVIASLQKAINALNTANSEINALSIQVAGKAIDAQNARNEALTALATLQGGAIDNTTIAPNKAFSNQYIENNFVKLTGNSSTATSLLGDETNWTSYRSRSVANMLGWKNYGNGYCIFDASASTAPNGVAINQTNPTSPWSPSFPTLMGWNGGHTFGVRVDSARVADSTTYAVAFTTAVGSAPSYACRAWVNFNGTGTVAIRASGNVSSITDNGVGDYTVNFTVAMPDVNYNIIGTAREDSIGNTANFALGVAGTILPLAGSFKVLISNNITSGSSDSTIICASVFR